MAQKGKPVFFKYLKEIDATLKKRCQAKNVDDWLTIEQVEEAMQVQVSYGLKRLIDKMAASKATKKDQINSLFSLDIIRVS